MKIKLLRWKFEISVTEAVGLALVLVGSILLALSLSAHFEIEEIGSTNDPALQDRILALEDQRDAFLMVGIGTLFLGFFTIFVLVERSSPSRLQESHIISSARNWGEVLSGLSLTGNASYLPARHGLTREKVFIPAPANRSIPPVALSDDLTMSPGKDGSTPGMIVEPLGLHLLEEIEKELGSTFEDVDIETVEGMLQMIKHGLTLVGDFHIREEEEKITLRVEYKEFLEACRTVRRERPDTCRQIACIGCSCILAALARASGRIVQIQGVENTTDRVVFDIALREW